MIKFINGSKSIIALNICAFLIFSKGVTAETFEELMISTWGNHLKKDLTAYEEIEKKYFKCTRELKNESIREAKANGNYEYIVKMDNNISFEPPRYDCITELCYEMQYRYTAIGPFDVYGTDLPRIHGRESSAFIYKNKLVLLEGHRNTSFQCTEINSFFKIIKAQALILTGKARRSFMRWMGFD